MARGEGSGVGHPAPEDMWLIRPGTGKTPTVAFEVSGHEERAGHTWYQLNCFLTLTGAPSSLSWKTEKRLSSLREEMHDRVKEALGQNYASHFAKTPFAMKGGLPGTTARLNAWFGALGSVMNKGEAPPSLVAVILQFLEVPELPEPEEASTEAKVWSPEDLEVEEPSAVKIEAPRDAELAEAEIEISLHE
ncbi:unnamed protein product [Effrenium voratum]|nr:unnamed protein product [Effrenium voratum]